MTDDFSAALKIWRTSRGLTQRQAASVLRVSPRTLEGWEIGHRRPSPSMRNIIEDKIARSQARLEAKKVDETTALT